MLRTRLKTYHLTEGETEAYGTWAAIQLSPSKPASGLLILLPGILTLQRAPGQVSIILGE